MRLIAEIRQLAITAFLLVVVAAEHVQAAPAAIHECRLTNGMQVLVQEDHRAPVVAIQLWYKVGASYEHEGITGISHVLEHMMSKGTPRYPKGRFSRLIAANGGIKNATTAADFTFYYTEITPDKVPLVLEMEADRMRNLLFKETELKRELRVVMEERRMRIDDNPEGTLNERLRAAAFISSPYHHPVAGWPQDIRHLTIDDLRRWYQRWYVPDNAALVIVGDVNSAQICSLAQQTFGAVPHEPLAALKPQTEMPQLGAKTIIINFPANSDYVYLGYPVPGLKTASQSWEPYALIILAKLLTDPRSDFQQQLTRKQILASSIAVEYIPYSRLDNLLTIKARVATGVKSRHLVQKLFAELNKLQTHLLPERQLQQIKRQLITEQIFEQDNLASRAREIGRLTAIGLPYQILGNFEKNINAVTAEQLREAARHYLTAARSNTATLNHD